MKNSFALIMFIVCSIIYTSAQLESMHWQEAEYHFDSGDPSGEAKILMNYWIKGDTVFGGIGYKKLYSECVYQDSAEFHNDGLIYRYGIFFRLGIREDEQGRIFISDNESYPTELLLYDFSDWNIGDTLFLNGGSDEIQSRIITESNLDSIPLLDGNYAKTISFDPFVLIRGIGFANGFLFPIAPYPGSIMRSLIVRFYKGDQLLWENPNYVGLEEHGKEALIKVYSVNSSLNFVFPSTFNQLELYSLDGVLLHSFSNQGNTTDMIGPLPKGVYLYKVMYANSSSISRGKAVVR